MCGLANRGGVNLSETTAEKTCRRQALTHPAHRLDKPVDSLLASVNQNSVHERWGRYQVRRGVFGVAASAQKHAYKDSTPQLTLAVFQNAYFVNFLSTHLANLLIGNTRYR